MISVSAHVDVERTPEELWAFLMDPTNAPRWEQNVVASERLDDGSIGVGARFRKTLSLFGIRYDVDVEIAEYQPDRHCSVVLVAGPISGGGSYSLEPIPGGTRLTYGVRHQMSGVLRLAEPVMRRAYPKLLAKDLATLKLAVETARETAEHPQN